jgi:hypothetical protein
VVEERKRCGWGAVLAAVALFAILLVTVPDTPATAAPADGTPVVVRHTGAGEATDWLATNRAGRFTMPAAERR